MSAKRLGKKQAKIILEELSDALRNATMKNASFNLGGGELMGNKKDTKRIKEATKLYRESWIINPLERVIKQLKEIYEI